VKREQQKSNVVDFQALRQRLDLAEHVLQDGDQGMDRAKVLAERAAQVARAREEALTGAMSVLAFKVGGERYAVEVGAVFQVVDATGLHPLPAVPTWVLGAILARTRVVPVLDLRALLGLEGGGMSDLAKIVVLEDGADLFGVAVEDLEGRLDLEREKLASATDGPFAWIAPDRLAVLDLSRIGAPSTPVRGN
jgi:purine-binding chemotaxis protein CheW